MMDELIAKLRRKRAVLHDTITLYRTLELVNPDGPEAADALTTLQVREATLVNLLRQAQASFRYTLPKFPDVEHAIDEALATSDLAEGKNHA